MSTKNKITSPSHWLTIRAIQQGADRIIELGLRTQKGWVVVSIAAMITVIILVAMLK
jgi:hypothetical protein